MVTVGFDSVGFSNPFISSDSQNNTESSALKRRELWPSGRHMTQDRIITKGGECNEERNYHKIF